MALYSRKGYTDKQLEIRDVCMSDLKAFVGLVAPYRCLGHCHLDLLDMFMQDGTHQLVLWPRGHQKSTMIAYWVCWYLINNPTATILYASATAALAEKQNSFIKQILDSPIVRKYWPEFLKEGESSRSLWRQDEFNTDHPLRGEMGIRDPSVKAVGMGANITGFHADAIVLDDIVVLENSISKNEREKVKTWYSLLTSILNPGGLIKAVGTRYHPEDLWNDLMDMSQEIFNDEGDVIESQKVYTWDQKVVEEDGEFLWPRQRRKDNSWFGFNKKELSKIRASYLDKAQFHAQYYNNPTDPDNKPVTNFNYYERDLLQQQYGYWYIGSKRLNVFAAIDFAATMRKESDYTAIVVVGIDEDHIVHILDIDRFKTDKISVMCERLSIMFDKWRWIKLRAEATAAQNLVVNEIKEYNKKQAIYYSVDAVKPTTEKEIRIMTNLEPRYAAGHILHYRGGNCQVLEDELSSSRPAHDDISDALASVVEIAQAPSKRASVKKVSNITFHPRWGGVT